MAVSKAALALALAYVLPAHGAALSQPAADSSPIEKRAASQQFSASSNTYWLSGPPFLALDNGYHFSLQGDGNFVITDGNQKAVWNSGYFNECGNGRCHLQFQGDGNLVAVDYGVSPPHVFWSTGTQDHVDTTDNYHVPQAVTLKYSNTEPYIILTDQKGEAVYFSYGFDQHAGGISDSHRL